MKWLNRHTRLFTPRRRTVLWGHHRGDHSPGLLHLDPTSPFVRSADFQVWLRDHGLDPNFIFAVDVGQVGMRVYRWARDEDGDVRLALRDGEWRPVEEPVLDVRLLRPLPSVFDPLVESVNRGLRALGVRQLTA